MMTSSTSRDTTFARIDERSFVRSIIAAALGAMCGLAILNGCNGKSSGGFTPANVSLKQIGGGSGLKELLDDRLVFRDGDDVWVAPKGTHTDGASIPSLFLPVTGDRFDQSFLKAAVVHDAYCQDINKTRCPEQYQSRSWQDTHDMFYDACIAGGTSSVLAKLMWAAVWIAGPRWDDPGSEPAEVREEALQYALTGYKKWIEKEAPSFEKLKAQLPERAKRLFRMYRNEQSMSKAIDRGDLPEVRRVAKIQRDLLDSAARTTPEDPTTDTFRGLLLLKRTTLLRRDNKERAADQMLQEAETRLESVTRISKDDPAALRGLAEVAVQRKQWDKAQRRIDRAVEVAPKFREARRIREVIRRR